MIASPLAQLYGLDHMAPDLAAMSSPQSGANQLIAAVGRLAEDDGALGVARKGLAWCRNEK
jgi:hypothetical protein